MKKLDLPMPHINAMIKVFMVGLLSFCHSLLCSFLTSVGLLLRLAGNRLFMPPGSNFHSLRTGLRRSTRLAGTCGPVCWGCCQDRNMGINYHAVLIGMHLT